MANNSIAVGQLQWAPRSKQQWEKWSGRGWAPALYSVNPQQLVSQDAWWDQPPTSDERRERLLRQVVDAEVLGGASVVHLDRLHAIFSTQRRVNHVLHAFMFIITLGVWSTVWIIRMLTRGEDRFRVDIDEWGNAWATQAV